MAQIQPDPDRLLPDEEIEEPHRALVRLGHVEYSKLPKERQDEVKKQWQELQAQREGQRLPASIGTNGKSGES